ncbi:MAG: hypothetical protein JNM39_17195 [Bdellovibrionaceae bacterium]|nr:hypothetical protein [Pseudobdellovibrionaceae bacterium]
MLRRFGFHGMSSLLFLLLVNSFSFATPSRVTETKPAIQQSWQSDVSTLKPDDIPVPIPFSLRLPFPWTLTYGTWAAQKGEFQSYFSFKIIQERGSQERQILVRQIDAVSCSVIARGIGFVKNDSMSAKMLNLVDGRSYILDLTSLPESVLPKQISATPIRGRAMILSITTSCLGQETFHMGLHKMANQLDFDCNSDHDFGKLAF